MTTYYEPLPKPARGYAIALLILTILNWPWPFWNCVYGFFAASYFGYNNYSFDYDYYYSYQTSSWNTVAGLGLAFGLVTVAHGLFGFAKVSVFAMDLDSKISSHVRRKFLNAYLSESVMGRNNEGRRRWDC